MGLSTEQVADDDSEPGPQCLSLANVLVAQTGISHLEAARLAASIPGTSETVDDAPADVADGPPTPGPDRGDGPGRALSSALPAVPDGDRLGLSTEVVGSADAMSQEPSIEQFAHGPDHVGASTWRGDGAVSSEREMQLQTEDEYVQRWRTYSAMLLLVAVAFALVAVTVALNQPAVPGLVSTVWLGSVGFAWLGTATFFTTVLLRAVCRDVRHQTQELERLVRRAAARFPATPSN